MGLLATYLIPGCVGRGVRLGSESSSGGGVWKSGNLEIWEFGDLGIWRSGHLEIWELGDLGTWKSRKVEIWGPGNSKFWDPKNQKIKSLKIQIRSAQNVGKVWISRKKILPALFGAILGHFFHGPKKSKKCQNFAYFPGVGPLLLSTRGGE